MRRAVAGSLELPLVAGARAARRRGGPRSLGPRAEPEGEQCSVCALRLYRLRTVNRLHPDRPGTADTRIRADAPQKRVEYRIACKQGATRMDPCV